VYFCDKKTNHHENTKGRKLKIKIFYIFLFLRFVQTTYYNPIIPESQGVFNSFTKVLHFMFAMEKHERYKLY